MPFFIYLVMSLLALGFVYLVAPSEMLKEFTDGDASAFVLYTMLFMFVWPVLVLGLIGYLWLKFLKRFKKN